MYTERWDRISKSVDLWGSLKCLTVIKGITKNLGITFLENSVNGDAFISIQVKTLIIL